MAKVGGTHSPLCLLFLANQCVPCVLCMNDPIRGLSNNVIMSLSILIIYFSHIPTPHLSQYITLKSPGYIAKCGLYTVSGGPKSYFCHLTQGELFSMVSEYPGEQTPLYKPVGTMLSQERQVWHQIVHIHPIQGTSQVRGTGIPQGVV